MSPAIRHHWLRSTIIVERVADRLADRGHDGDPVVDGVAGDPDLDRPEPLLDERHGVLGAPIRGAQLAQRRVCRQPIARATEQRRDRDARAPAVEIPECRLERPVAARVKRDRLERAGVGGERQRVAADEQVLELLEAAHRVAAGDSGQSLVGLERGR